MMDDRTKHLVEECARQEESCLYTSTTLFIWLRSVRFWKRVFMVAPIILGGLAGWSILEVMQPEVRWITWMTATFALLAGLSPAVYEALKLDVHIEDIARHAAEFKSRQDRFRQTKNITARGPFEELEVEFRKLMERLEQVRSPSITPPERFFVKARKKIKEGHYDFDEVGEPSSRAGSK